MQLNRVLTFQTLLALLFGIFLLILLIVCLPCAEHELLSCQEAYLTRPQKERLRAIQRGTVTRRHVEIVMSRFQEDISWSDVYAPLRTVYDKFPLGWRAPRNGTIYVENVGRESYVYLKHIVDHYDTLADLTVFTQAGLPTAGYETGHPSAYRGHMSPGFSFHDFVLADTPGFVLFNHAMRLDNLHHVVRPLGRRWMRLLGWARLDAQVCPLNSHFKAYWTSNQNSDFIARVSKLCESQGAGSLCSADTFWKTFVRLPPPPADKYYHWVQGARYAVTRNQIRQRPRHEYDALLSLVSHDKDPWAGYFLEWFFYPILTSAVAHPCASSDE